MLKHSKITVCLICFSTSGQWHERGSGNSGSREQTSFINRVSVALWVHCIDTLEPSHVCFIFHLHIHFIFVCRKNIRYICADAASFETINLAVDEDEMDMEMEYGTINVQPVSALCPYRNP